MSKNSSHEKNLSANRRGPRWRVVVIALVLSLASGSVGQTRAAAGVLQRGVPSYEVIAEPDELTLCPGESATIIVVVFRRVTRTVGGTPVTASLQNFGNAGITARLYNSQVAGLSGATALVPGGPIVLQIPTRLGIWPISVGQFTGNAAPFTVTGAKPGDTTIEFGYPGGIGSQGVQPKVTVPVHVKCQFKVSMTDSWTITGQDRTFHTLAILRNVVLTPDAAGAFVTTARMNNTITSDVADICQGGSSVSDSDATFDGTLDANGKLKFEVTYGSVSTSGNESCAGRGKSEAGTPQPLMIDRDMSSGRRFDFFTMAHYLKLPDGTFYSSTLIYIYRIP